MASEATSDESAATVCWCCGVERGESELARLECHSEVALCDVCLDWLGDKQALRRGNRLRRAVPILATADVARALEHYAALGFETEAWEGGGYGFASRDGVELHLGEVEGHDPATTPTRSSSSGRSRPLDLPVYWKVHDSGVMQPAIEANTEREPLTIPSGRPGPPPGSRSASR